MNKRDIDLTRSQMEQWNAQMADEQAIPIGDFECRACGGHGFVSTLTGPLQCTCTKVSTHA